MPIFRRHKILLGILKAAFNSVSKTQLVKLAFLLRQESELALDASYYDFVPYKFGPFSFTLYRDLEELAKIGLLKEGEQEVCLLKKEEVDLLIASLPKSLDTAIRKTISIYGGLSHAALIETVYKKYPWFASKSELLPPGRQPETMKDTALAVYTAGYQGKSIDSFLQQLLSSGIQRIIDVRNNPLSRKYGFSRNALAGTSRRLGLDYVHLPELGIPSEYRKNLNHLDDYKVLLRRYDDEFLPQAQEAKGEAKKLLCSSPSVLVCFEADHHCCHRNPLAKALAVDTALKIVNL